MKFLTVQEAADYLRVALITVRRYIAQGRLAAVKVGRAVRVTKEALDNLPEPVQPSEGEQAKMGSVLTMEDPIWRLAGISESDEATDVSANKHKYLADANMPRKR